jgi:hypothetical protein
MVDDKNPYFSLASQFVNHTNRHIFLTGKAGTGKTTFLKHIAETSLKKMAIVAPTGVAAINAGGVTIHSMFQIPFGCYLPGTGHDWKLNNDFVTNETLFRNLRLTKPKKELLRELELLIIDEVSMLRADLLDEIDAVLRFVRKRPHLPFGGLQMLYIGDLYQLPPVVRNPEWSVLRNYYNSPFFFDAHVLKENPPVYIELKKIYRQHDEEFIEILNNIRNNEATVADLRRLHQHYRSPGTEHSDDAIITLTTHNAKADNINLNKLNRLSGRTYNYKGIVSGEFPMNALPAEMDLQLKVGAQVMFIKNDTGEIRRYYNGKLALITQLSSDTITVSFKDEPGEFEVPREEWENIRYSYNRSGDNIDKDVLGSYKQYPLRLAWAITIHKSQGLTFEKAIVDAGDAFAAGQVYVALSRLTSLEGLSLRSRILPGCIDTDPKVLDFARSEKSNELLEDELSEGQRTYYHRKLLECFDWTSFAEQVKDHHNSYVDRDLPDETVCMEWIEKVSMKVKGQKEVADKFIRQLEQLIFEEPVAQYGLILNRVRSAHEFFNKDLDELIGSIKIHMTRTRVKSKSRKYIMGLRDFNENVERRKLSLRHALIIAETLSLGEDVMSLPVKLKEAIGENKVEEIVLAKPAKGETFGITLQMFREGKDIPGIASLRGLARSTIEGHLCKFVEEGEIGVEQLVSGDKIARILEVIAEMDQLHSKPIRDKLGEDYTFYEIRAVINHHKRAKKISYDNTAIP